MVEAKDKVRLDRGNPEQERRALPKLRVGDLVLGQEPKPPGNTGKWDMAGTVKSTTHEEKSVFVKFLGGMEAQSLQNSYIEKSSRVSSRGLGQTGPQGDVEGWRRSRRDRGPRSTLGGWRPGGPWGGTWKHRLRPLREVEVPGQEGRGG